MSYQTFWYSFLLIRSIPLFLLLYVSYCLHHRLGDDQYPIIDAAGVVTSTKVCLLAPEKQAE